MKLSQISFKVNQLLYYLSIYWNVIISNSLLYTNNNNLI